METRKIAETPRFWRNHAKIVSQKLRQNLRYSETSKRDGASPRLGVSRYYMLYKVYGGAGVRGVASRCRHIERGHGAAIGIRTERDCGIVTLTGTSRTCRRKFAREWQHADIRSSMETQRRYQSTNNRYQSTNILKKRQPFSERPTLFRFHAQAIFSVFSDVFPQCAAVDAHSPASPYERHGK